MSNTEPLGGTGWIPGGTIGLPIGRDIGTGPMEYEALVTFATGQRVRYTVMTPGPVDPQTLAHYVTQYLDGPHSGTVSSTVSSVLICRAGTTPDQGIEIEL